MPARYLYSLGYRFFRMPWEIGPRDELVELVQTGQLRPARTIDLGCGTGANAIFLAEHGFTVTGVDFARAALAKARRKAGLAGVGIDFVEGDLTDLPAGLGGFDLLVDYGTFDDLNFSDRTRYVECVSSLAQPGAQFLLWCFEWPPRWRDAFLGLRPVAPGEIAARFGRRWEIDRVVRAGPDLHRYIAGTAAYLMRYR